MSGSQPEDRGSSPLGGNPKKQDLLAASLRRQALPDSLLASSLGLETLDMVPVCAAQHGLAVAAKPAVEQGGIDPAKVGVELQVAGIESRQAGMAANNAPLDRRPGHE